MPKNDDDAKNAVSRHGLRCANCGSTQVTTTTVDDEFKYGEGACAVSLSARVPLRTCQNCGFQFLDAEAEDLRQEAIAVHQGGVGARGG